MSNTIEANINSVSKRLDEHTKGMAELRLSQQKTARQIEETNRQMKETDRQMKETDRQIKETGRQIRETGLQMKESGRKIKYLDELFSNQWGKLMESLVEGDLVKILKNRSIKIERLYEPRSFEKNRKHYEFDLIAVNGSEVVVVEVKTTLWLKDVDHFLGKLIDFKNVCTEFSNKKVYGAVAYLKANQSADRYSDKKGLFVIRATGSSASITNEKNFKPREF